ncbi:MAG: hypothetical protein CBD77_00215 [bacterium TMED217]|nr:MAG: hypothetical protein CBD77_00215 [bacterium TMED217]
MNVFLYASQYTKYMGGHFRSLLTTAKYLNIGKINAFVGLPESLKKRNYIEIKNIFPYEKIVWLPKNRYLPREIFLTKYLQKVIKKQKIDLIHSFDLSSHIISSLYKMIIDKNIRICATVCGGTIGHKYPFSYPIIVYSKELKEMMIKRFQFNKNGIFIEKSRMDISLFRKDLENNNLKKLIPGKNDHRKNILFITRISNLKINAILLLFEGVVELSEKRKDFCLVMVAFSENNKLRKFIEKKIEDINKKIGDEIIVHAKELSSSSISLYKNFDIIIGVARVCFEAMMSSKPVILIGERGCSGIIDVKNKKYLKKLIKTNFSSRELNTTWNVQKVSVSIDYLLNNPKLMHQYGIDGKKWVEKHMDAHHLISAHRKIYQNLLKNEKQKLLLKNDVFYSIIIRWIAIFVVPIRNFFYYISKVKK